jgi:predicted acylesterase/phospholipase RssA
VEPPNNADTQHGIVLTGTLANAAFEVGVLQGLLGGEWGDARNPPIQPFCYSGTSTGALNAAAMVSMAHLPAAEALVRLEEIWLYRIAASAGGATGFFRIRGDPTQYLQTKYLSDPARPWIDLARDTFHIGSEFMRRAGLAVLNSSTVPDGAVQLGDWSDLLDITPLRHLIADVIDSEQIVNNRELCKLRVTTVDWQKGTPRTFDNDDFASVQEGAILVAAQAVPGVTPPETVDGLPYVDSGMLFDKPLKPAISAGKGGVGSSLELHVVHVDASKRDIALPQTSNTIAAMYRLYLLALSRAILTDIARADDVNKRLWTRRLLQTIKSAVPDASSLADDNFAYEGVRKREEWDLKGKRPVSIHRYAPTRIRGMELCWFDRERIRELILDGKEAAQRHNCREAGCISTVDAGEPKSNP